MFDHLEQDNVGNYSIHGLGYMPACGPQMYRNHQRVNFLGKPLLHSNKLECRFFSTFLTESLGGNLQHHTHRSRAQIVFGR